jgi:hypothetical protein
MIVKTASESLGWMDSVGPLTVAPGRPKESATAVRTENPTPPQQAKPQTARTEPSR